MPAAGASSRPRAGNPQGPAVQRSLFGRNRTEAVKYVADLIGRGPPGSSDCLICAPAQERSHLPWPLTGRGGSPPQWPARGLSGFYASIASTSKQAATIVLPPMLVLLDRCGYPVRSAVDVGAGVGSWLAVACEHGISDILALEGAWVRDLKTAVPADAYSYVDVGDPPAISRRFDLAVCLEVAEHLPPTSAEQLVETLVGLSDVVLFAAAIRHQGGTHHVNEQWPCDWADRFRARNYFAWDGLRWSLWRNSRVPFWYRQNILLFLNTKRQELCRALVELPYGDFMPDSPCACVHPAKYEAMIEFSRCPRSGCSCQRCRKRSIARSIGACENCSAGSPASAGFNL